MPRTVDIEERRQELTDAAARLIAQAGIGAVTVRAVAAEAGWSTGALTHYFADKRELLLATLAASLANRRRQQDLSWEGDGPRGALRSALVNALPVDQDSRRHWMVTVAFCAEAASDPKLAAAQRQAYRHHRSHVTDLVQQAVTDGGVAAVAVAERLIALTDGVALQALFDPASWPASRQLDALDDALSSLTA